MKPGHYVCGAGSEINCNYWDDVNGCWNNCNEFGEKDCMEIRKEEGDYPDCLKCGYPEPECECEEEFSSQSNEKEKKE